jgi:[ribosomal protein S5]-alanine N-acetyltransferase
MPLPNLDHLRTERLVLERMRAADLDDLRRMHRDPVLMASIGGVRGDDETRLYLAEQLGHWEAHHIGIWMAHESATDRLAGRGGLRLALIDGHAETELAYVLVPDVWGRGLATELARACLGVAFDVLGCADVIAYTAPANAASRRVMEKCGFALEREFTHKGAPRLLHRLGVNAWRAAAQSAGERGA